jgi:glycosyltransferase involved in cell wall biosynthesis
VKPVISIIIPTLDEAHTICPTLASIATNETPHEVIVVDGGVRMERQVWQSEAVPVSWV